MSKAPEDETGFLSRWSRRKRGQEEAAEAAPPTGKQEAEQARAAAAADETAQEAENRAAAEAVDLEALTYESDYNLFLKPGVPGALRNQALRRLWRSNPLLANLDGLNDYDEDFTTPAGAAAAAVRTGWKVGKGFVDKLAEDAEPREETAPRSEAAAERPTQSVSTRLPEEAAEPAAEREESPSEAAAEAEAEPPAAAEEPQRVGLRARLDLGAFRERSSES